jgi:hypothetical protein
VSCTPTPFSGTEMKVATNTTEISVPVGDTFAIATTSGAPMFRLVSPLGSAAQLTVTNLGGFIHPGIVRVNASELILFMTGLGSALSVASSPDGSNWTTPQTVTNATGAAGTASLGSDGQIHVMVVSEIGTSMDEYTLPPSLGSGSVTLTMVGSSYSLPGGPGLSGPSLSQDATLLVYRAFTATGTSNQILFAKRAAITDAFALDNQAVLYNAPSTATTPALSDDCLTLYFDDSSDLAFVTKPK